jgi:hypothetical protein
MGFNVGDTGAPNLSHNQRIHPLGQCTDLNAISWTVATFQTHLAPTEIDTPTVTGSTHIRKGYTYSQPLPTDMPFFPSQRYKMPPYLQGSTLSHTRGHRNSSRKTGSTGMDSTFTAIRDWERRLFTSPPAPPSI